MHKQYYNQLIIIKQSINFKYFFVSTNLTKIHNNKIINILYEQIKRILYQFQNQQEQ